MSNLSFPKALRKFSKTDRVAIEVTLGKWAKTPKGRVIVPNLQQLERFLPVSSMHALLKVILKHRSSSIADLNAAYNQECHRHVGRGGRVRLSNLPPLLGRVVGRDYFVKWLANTYRMYFYKEAYVEDFLDRLLLGLSMKATERGLRMSPYLAWVTFDRNDLSGTGTSDPFAFLRSGRAIEVKASLGLDPKLGKRVLLLILQTPSSMELLRPTVADAGLFEFFEPPDKAEEKHGWTKPWPPQFLSSSFKTIEISPQPEALHKPMIFRTLKLPIRELA